MTIRCGLVGVVMLGLSACSGEPAAPEPTPTTAETPDAAATEPVSIIRDDVDVAHETIPLEPLDTRISFGEGGYKLSKVAIGELQAVLETRQFKAGGAIVLRGHTDSAGGDTANLHVAQKRAEAVRRWMVDNGVAEKRITVIAIGEQNPAKPNAMPDGTPDEAGRAFNRRVEVAIAVPDELAGPSPEDEVPTLVEQVSAPD